MDETTRGTVAVIVVHGVANQVRGETAAAVAAQLAAIDGASVARSDIAVATPPLQPAGNCPHIQARSAPERTAKSFRQSIRSDYLDARDVAFADEGAKYTDYLIAKARTAEPSGPENYEMPCFQLRGATRKLDVFEMYWADLSNLQGFFGRIAAELFYILFHLSKLGADTVSLAAHKNRDDQALRCAAGCQRFADWMFSRLLAILSLQLVVCMLLLIPRAVMVDGKEVALTAALAVVGLLAVAAMVYRYGALSWALPIWCVIVPGALLAYIAMRSPSTPQELLPSSIELLWLLAVVVLHDAFLRFAEARFKAVLGVGRGALAVTVAYLVWGAMRDGWGWDAWSTGALMALEAILVGYATVWIMLALAIAGMAVAAFSAARKRGAAASRIRQALVTGHLGLYVSLGAFLAAVMALWGILEESIKKLVGGMPYAPIWFTDSCAAYCAQQCPDRALCADPGSAACFVEGRYAASTMGFALLVVVLLVLLGYAVLVFLPSVLVEIRAYRDFAADLLGSWLTKGYRSMERLVQWWSIVVAVLAVVFALALLDSQLIHFGVYTAAAGGPAAELRHSLTQAAGSSSATFLKWVVYAFTGGAVGLAASGSVTIKRIQAIRAPLDAALDVDKHFREFPRKEIIRVQILERYVALLTRLKAMGYNKIVIVAHSQGTVITADLLRYIRQRPLIAAAHDERLGNADIFEALRTWLAQIDARLFTVGCPLRQLYANRFPRMYSWVLEGGGTALGPDPRALGVGRWVNLWGCGDYVGRWLWSPAGAGEPQAFREMAAASYVRNTRYDAPDGTSTDLSIGTDAHTHYFDLEQMMVARELARLIP